MLYTEKEKNEIERVRKVFEKHIQQMTAYDLVWSDKVGYVWLAISIDPVYSGTVAIFLISSMLFPSSVMTHSHFTPLSSSTYILPLSR